MLVNGWIGNVVEPSLGYLGTLCLRVSFGVPHGEGGHGVIDVGVSNPGQREGL